MDRADKTTSVTRPDVEMMRDLLAERVESHLASCLEVDRAEDGARLSLGLSSAECRMILAALRSTGTGRSEAEAGAGLEAENAYLREELERVRDQVAEERTARLVAEALLAGRALPAQTAGGAGE